MSRTLEGVRVLDLSRMLAGPYGTLLLADMGAEVIKVEERDGGDAMRGMGPPFIDDQSAYFLAVNRNKKSVTLDLKKPEGREVFLDLVRASDVVVDNFRAGVMERLDLGPDVCREARADVITCSMTAFGSDGPYRDLPAFDLILQAMGGAMSLTGEPDRPPVRMGIPMGDLAGGMFAAQAICAALFHRLRTGEGQHIDLSLLDCQVSLLTYMAGFYWADGQVPGKPGSGHQAVVPYQAFPTRDGWLVVAVFVEHFWPKLCSVLGLSELLEAFPTNADRLEARDRLVPLLEDRFRQRTSDEWISELWKAGVPSGPVNTIDRVLSDPQVLHRKMVDETASPHPVVGTYKVLGNPIKAGDEDVFQPAPLLGQHNDEVYGGLLGRDLAALAQADVT